VIGLGFAAPEHRRLVAPAPDVPAVPALPGVMETGTAAANVRLRRAPGGGRPGRAGARGGRGTPRLAHARARRYIADLATDPGSGV
jgi:hypothetical protein